MLARYVCDRATGEPVGIDLNALAARIADEVSGSEFGRSPEREALRPSSAQLTLDAISAVDAPRAASLLAPRGVLFARGEISLARIVELTLLAPEATRERLERLCLDALEHRVAAVCVNPAWVPLCTELLVGSGVEVSTVIGFPFGMSQPEIKAAEAELAVQQGAAAVELVLPLGHMKRGDWALVAADVASVVRAASGALVKVVIEAGLLTPIELLAASAVVREAGAHYLSANSGFRPDGRPSAEAVTLMRLAVGDAMGLKVSTTTIDPGEAEYLLACGATRIGATDAAALVHHVGSGPRPLRLLLGAAGSAPESRADASLVTQSLPSRAFR
jgi:deoxyribose-phosphate aldolase